MNECILWSGTIDRHGYGRVGKHKLAHRAAWERERGPIPAGLVIDHLCRCRPCVNVKHMELVTPAENTRRGISATKTHCKHGHEFNEANTYRKSTSGARSCRACNLAAVIRYQQREAA